MQNPKPEENEQEETEAAEPWGVGRNASTDFTDSHRLDLESVSSAKSVDNPTGAMV
jgi:hypothetical protein